MQTLYLPPDIQKIIQGKRYTIDTVGRSVSSVLCFEDCVLKIEKLSAASDNEHRMLRWLAGKLPVPKILCSATENQTNYLLMERVCGRMSCALEAMADPTRLTSLLAQGLQLLWQVDCRACPTCQSLDNKLAFAEKRLAAGLCTTEDAEPGTFGKGGFKDPAHLLLWLQNNRP